MDEYFSVFTAEPGSAESGGASGVGVVGDVARAAISAATGRRCWLSNDGQSSAASRRTVHAGRTALPTSTARAQLLARRQTPISHHRT